MSLFEDLSNITTRAGVKNVGSPSEVEFVHSQGDIVRIVPIPELPRINYEEITEADQVEIRDDPYGAGITAEGLPDGWGSLEATFIIACGGSYTSTVPVKCTISEQNPGEVVLPGEAHKVFAQPIFCVEDGNWYCANPVTASTNMTVVYRPMVFPTGCPYDMNLVVQKDTQSWVAVQKHTSCGSNGLGNGVFERYATIQAKDQETGLWAFFGQNSDFNLKSIAKADQAIYQLYNKESSYYLECVVKNSESSIWGYAGDGDFNFRASAKADEAFFDMWGNGGGFSTKYFLNADIASLYLQKGDAKTSAWVQNGNAGIKIEKGDDHTFSEPGKLWTKFAGGDYSYMHGNGFYTKTSSNWVDIQPQDANIYFQKVLLGDLTKRWVLCSDDTGGALDCADLPAPKVGDVEAFSISTLSQCGPFSTNTSLDLTNANLSFTGGGDSAVYKLEGAYINGASGGGSYLDESTLYIWDSLGVSARLSTNSGSGTLDVFNSLGGQGYYAATLAKLQDSNGTSSLTTQSIFIEKPGGSYAALNGSGWLQLRDSQGRDVYLDPIRLVFSDDTYTATHDAYGFVAQDSGEEGRLNSNSLSLFNNSGSADLSFSELSFAASSGSSANYRIDGAYINGANGDGSYIDKSTVSLWDSNGAKANYFAGGLEILGDAESTFVNLSGLQIINSGSNTNIWAGGVYVNDGSNWVNIIPPGANAYFQSVSVCVNGVQKTAMVLMTEPQ